MWKNTHAYSAAMKLQGQNHLKITRKRIKVKKEDRISSLPDCLILEILSRLPDTKHAIRTGAISKRWQHLWPQVLNLLFLYDNKNNYNDYKYHKDFLSFVDKTLTHCRQLNLNKFKLITRYNNRFESQVTGWIRYAINRNVQDLDLQLWQDSGRKAYVLDDSFFITSCFTHLNLWGCISKPPGAIRWKNLSSLSISKAKLDEDLIQNILSGSPLLETLTLEHCYGFKLIDITSKSVRKLLILGYNNPEDAGCRAEIVEINASYIRSLTIQGDILLWKLLLVDVSCLVKAELDYWKGGYTETTHKKANVEMLERFMLNLRHVKELSFGNTCQKMHSNSGADLTLGHMWHVPHMA
ncbi:F-box/LRR-repeat protein 25-like protein [Tanacetum coccineum]